MNPVVLVAEELAPAALDVLAHDFDVRHVDGTVQPCSPPSPTPTR